MAELDFSKIFGETATSKVSLTDENYLNGWGYLGSTPPPYQLFDYLQSLNDKKSKYLYDKTIENDNKLALHNTNATAHADIRAKITSEINSHNSNTSAHATILNAIKAISGMDAYNTAPSKTIAAMIPLLGYGGIVASKLDSNGYVKFANGFTIQWGYSEGVNAYNLNYNATVTFPIASNVIGVLPALFDNDSTTFNDVNYNNSLSVSVLNFDNTKANILIDSGPGSTFPRRYVKVYYIAIGLNT